MTDARQRAETAARTSYGRLLSILIARSRDIAAAEDALSQAFEAALGRCSTPHAPWYAIPADRKWFRDLAVSQILRQELESLPLEWPKPSFDPTKIRVV